MKKTAVILAIALGFSFSLVNANHNPVSSTALETVIGPKISPLCMSIVKGDTETVKKLLGLGVDVNEKSAGMTPAIYAARYNRVEILNYLIESGANLKVKCDKGYTALEHAEMSNATEAKAAIKSALDK